MTGLGDVAAFAATAETRRPAGLAGAREALLAASELDASILVRGGATKLSWGATPVSTRPWLVVDTRDLAGVVDHDPADMTATVMAGTTLDDLQAQLAESGQELGADPPRRGGGSTLGGVFAANDAGPRRLRLGAIRDLVIGATVVLADGTVARSGGTVIKNVSGYDLAKLWCGSLGTLGLVAELTVRLHPLPEAVRTVRVDASPAAATAFVLDLLASPVECSAVEWSSRDSALLVRLEGRAAGLAGQADGLAAVAHASGLHSEAVDGDERVWEAWREAHAGHAGPVGEATVARAATLPGELAAAVEDLTEAARGTEVETAVHSHAALGLHDAIITGGDPGQHARVVAGWRERIRARGGSVVLRERRPGVERVVDPWGPSGSSRQLVLTRAVKAALDPDGRMAPGRFLGGI